MNTRRSLPRPTVLLTAVMGGLLAVETLLTFAQVENQTGPKVHSTDFAALAHVSMQARARRNPLEGDDNAVTAGKKLFQQHCSECHGTDARGGKRGPNLCAVAVEEATPGALFFVLTNGVIWHGMPGWSKLPEPERWQIVSYLKSLRS